MDEEYSNSTYHEIRDYLQERREHKTERERLISQYNLRDAQGNIDEEQLLYFYELEHDDIKIHYYESEESFEHNLNLIMEHYRKVNTERGEDFEFYRRMVDDDYIPTRFPPSEGIHFVNLRYHTNRPVVITDDLTERGFPPPVAIQRIINEQYPQYKQVLIDYYRPLGTTDATFQDFNKEQKESVPPTDERNEQILEHILYFMDLKPYRPLHYRAVAFTKMPLSTGTGYFDRSHYHTRALAKLTHSRIYDHKPTSKGYFVNATNVTHRVQIHNMKHYLCPQAPDYKNIQPRSYHWKRFIAKRATLLHTRNHISKDNPKARPVYNVDPLFLKIEAMLTFPAMVQTRPINSCLLYSLETIRGGCHYLDNLARNYSSFFTIDWSSFDQKVPRIITDIYYRDFLERLIIVSHGYSPTLEHHPKDYQPTDVFFKKMSNLLHCLHEWYNSMVFVTADGYAYQRLYAGIPSGLFNTQLIDSFVNLYVILDGLIEFGYTYEEIRDIKFFIMGDDNSGFTNQPLPLIEKFIAFLETYAHERWHMTLSQTKSIITALRHKIEVLGYTVNFGTPYRKLDKLVAQLAYPEHGLKPKFMSYRALGTAYAAAGQCPIFHQLCRDVYMAFIADKAELTHDIREKIMKHLSGPIKALDDYYDLIDYTRFPTFDEVRELYKEWRGSLDYDPKWDYSYFLTPPLYDEKDIMTMAQYRKQNNIPHHQVDFYLIDETIIKQEH